MQTRSVSFSLLSLGFIGFIGLLLASCGSGGGSGSRGPGVAPLPPLSSVQVATSSAGLDGFITTPQVTYLGAGLAIGDQDGSYNGWGGARSFVSFDHPSVPAGATIQSVVLRVYVEHVSGTPHVSLGPLVATHVDIGPSLESTDITTGVLVFNVGTLAHDASLGWKELDVTARYELDVLAGRTRTQFRLECRNDDFNSDGIDDFIMVQDGEGSQLSLNIPELVITYLEP